MNKENFNIIRTNFYNEKPFVTSTGAGVKRAPICVCGKNSSCQCKNKQFYGCCSDGKCGSCLNCNNVQVSETLDLLKRIDYKIHLLSQKEYDNLTKDYRNNTKGLKELSLLRKSILRYKQVLLLGGTHCISDNCLQRIFEKAKGYLGIGYSPEKSLHYKFRSNIPELEGITIDDSNLNSWLSKNPYCAPANEWEKLAYHICGKLDVKIEVEEIACNLAFDIIKEVLPLKVVTGLSLARVAQKNKFLNIRTDNECKLDWELLVEEVQDCEITYDVYLHLTKECNLTYDTILEAYKCGLSFSVENDTAFVTGSTFKYDLSKIDFNSVITNYDSLTLDNIDLAVGNSISNNDLKHLASDYNLNDKQLRTLKRK